jgi:hypothetical protein
MAEHTSRNSASVVLANLGKLLLDLETLYKDIHAHPELSMQETRTAGIAADRLRKAGYEVTPGVGKTGVVGLLRNGAGSTVMLRADMRCRSPRTPACLLPARFQQRMLTETPCRWDICAATTCT